MGTLCEEQQAQCSEMIQDLKITIHDTCMVFPAQETENKSMFLSNIDQVLNFHVETVHFFQSHQDFPFERVVEALKSALAKMLGSHYDYFAGRLKMNSSTGRLEIDCNAAGVGFLVASSDSDLDQLGDLIYPNPAFDQLTCRTPKMLNKDTQPQDQPLCVVQVTSFKCGGFAIGFSVNHTVFDGLSFKTFLDNLAAVAGDEPLAMIPCNDRHLLAARSPPRVTFPHPELVQLDVPLNLELNPPVFDSNPKGLEVKLLKISPEDIAKLKDKAKETSSTNRITSFCVVTAHVWRCKALSLSAGQDDNSHNPDDHTNRTSTVLYAVDIRSRLNPPLPKSYAGNAVLSSYATIKYEDIEKGSFGKLVDMVAEGASRMTDEYARSVIDWGELHMGFPLGDFLLSSWWKLGFANVEYPWGKPRYSCPVVYHRSDIILLLPDIEESDNGVNVLAALPSAEMEKFQAHFHEYLAS